MTVGPGLRKAARNPSRLPRLLKRTYLVEGESLLWEARPSRYLYLTGPVVFAVLVGLANLVIWDQVWDSPIQGWIPLPRYVGGHVFGVHSPEVIAGVVLVLLAVVFFAVRWFRYATTVFAVTTDRLIRQRGILSRDYKELQLVEVRGVDVRQSLGQRLLGYGTVIVTAESGGPSAFGNEDWEGIVRPLEFEKIVESAQENARNGVRGPAPVPPGAGSGR
jgi:hypothetical protein